MAAKPCYAEKKQEQKKQDGIHENDDTRDSASVGASRRSLY
ncbi:hypothetical protein DFP92_101127 [Yoonia sediminilitoris]|uniref:Uncharacterized protein n=1 Tax=Yoonia sediminilitoris TaxID=1286148 RepID=A0A2T6KPP5_9RHOB|nr:hypothetical protein C8N45_101127 [Yoonia sediminilitoris]RCW98711.1 hypothetical protein DFP92_101127 [Yoonia sediminilitoris]